MDPHTKALIALGLGHKVIDPGNDVCPHCVHTCNFDNSLPLCMPENNFRKFRPKNEEG